LICLPFSGGGASVYSEWLRSFPPEIEVVPLYLPGRERRIAEPISISPAVIARVLAERIDLPYAIYGHSMGARIGFEVLRLLPDLGVASPVRFYPGACPPPGVADSVTDCVDLPDDAFIAALIDRLGAPEDLRDTPELRQLLLPLLRHDLNWCREYQYRPGPRLATTIVALAGADDAEATSEKMAGWSRHGQRFAMRILPGGHFFIRTSGKELGELLAEDMLGALAGLVPPATEGSS
jgi:surfactin synthase thioesterase subunit